MSIEMLTGISQEPGKAKAIADALNGAASPSDRNVFATAADVTGGATASDQMLKDWTESGAYEMTAITYDDVNTETVDTATVKWPDGSAGVFTTTAFNTTANPARVNAYTITHADSGKTVTQAACTVDAKGNITVKPALTVA